MDERLKHPIPDKDDTLQVARSVRDVPPAHYTLKIESFSSLSQILVKSGVDKYETSDFEAGGYKWRLLLYPNGDKKRDANGHISLYLAMSETNDLPVGWEVNVNFKFLVYDQIRDKYLTLQFQDGKVRRFHSLKTKLGIPRLLSLSIFNDPSNGYLIDDCCVFGVDVFVIKSEGKGESFSIINEPDDGIFTWKIDKFSRLKKEFYESKMFTVQGHQWMIQVYPRGDSLEKGKSLSIDLYLVNYLTLHPGSRLYVEYKLTIKDQVNGEDYEGKCADWFCFSAKGWGYSNFMSLTDLMDAKNGYLLNDSLIIEAEMTCLSAVNFFV